MRLIATLVVFCTIISPQMLVAGIHDGQKPIGQVIFVKGVVLRHFDGQQQQLAAKNTLFAGDAVSTDAAGHVQIRFIDGGFVSVRPGTTLVIEHYHTESIRFRLEQGVGRFVTGDYGMARKDRFRVNTPVAAIGIRGTDFVAQADQLVARVLVHSGAVQVSPFTSQCAIDAFGPCSGRLSKVLTESQSQVFLEISGEGAAPKVRSRKHLPSDAAEAKLLLETPPAELPESEGTSVTNQPTTADVGDSVRWGRWSETEQAAMESEGFSLIGKNSEFALYRSNESIDLPASGDFNFSPTFTEAYAVQPNGIRQPAQITSPQLNINFAQQRFNTQLTWQADALSIRYQASGQIDGRGVMVASDPSSTMLNFYGVLSAKGQNAAYIFEGDTGTDLQALGLVRWQRDPSPR